MYVVESKGDAIVCMLLALLFLGTFPAVLTLPERRGRLPQHTYLDYSITNFLAPVIIALTFGETGKGTPSAPNFFTQLSQDNWPSVLFAMAGGVVLSIGNLSTQYSLALVGLSVTEVISSSIIVVIGTTMNYFLDDKINRADILFPGVGCFLIAVCLGSFVHASNAADNMEKLKSLSTEATGFSMDKETLTNDVVRGSDVENGSGSAEKARAGTAGFLIELENRRSIKVFGKSTIIGLAITFFAGICFSLFSPAFNLATNDQWHTLKEGVPHLSVYTAFFYFSVSCFVVGIILNIIFLYHPILNLPKSSLKAYLSDWNGRGWAFLTGFLCGFGNGLQFMGGEAAGYAAADAVQMNETREIPEGQRNEADQGVTNVHEDKGKPPLPPSAGNTGKKRSFVWGHFTVIEGGEKPRAACNYCGTTYASDTKLNGTTTMRNHIQSQCLKYPYREDKKNQSTLAFKPKEEGESSSKLVPWVFNFDECKKALAEMIILDELSFRFVEGFGFRKFMSVAQPRFNPIPCRTTIAKTCFRVFLDEKQKLKEALREQRVCLTTDTWTSVQNLNYMCLTAHFIDSDWKIHKRILSFCLVENHKGETLGKAVEMCLLDWGIDKILTITVDNAASNSGLISFIQKKTKHRKATVLGHKYLHVRCSAHILNLIVREGLVEMDETIVKVRKSVKYVRSSPQRQSTFKLCAEKEKVDFRNQLCLDVPTRWNYTYIMLEKAEKYQKAFERLEEDDPNFLRTIREEAKEEGNDRHEVAWGMDDVDWEKIRIFSKFLKIFYDATLRFSGANYVTSNSFFLELMSIYDTIELEHEKDSYLLRKMADYMKNKFEKYWGNFDNMNHLLYVGLVLDPRYKLRYLEYCFGTLYERQKAVDMAVRVKAVLEDLYKSYTQNQVGSSSASAAAQAQGQNPSGSMGGDDSNVVDAKAMRMMGFKKHLKGIDSSNTKSEVDKYLLESCEDVFDDNFDILVWWKVNSPRYRVLSRVARHVLAIPVSTVASESAFSTAGRVLDPFRSSLSPLMVEALICGQNWLRPSSAPICLRAAMDDVEEFEKLDGELMSDAALPTELGMSTPTPIEVDS